MSSKEGIIFDPNSKVEPNKSPVNLELSLEEIIAQKKKTSSRKTSDSKSRRGRTQRLGRKNRTDKETSKKTSRREKRESKKETQSKTPTKKNIELKVPESCLHDILNKIGVDTKDYNLRLVATKKK